MSGIERTRTPDFLDMLWKKGNREFSICDVLREENEVEVDEKLDSK